MPRVAIRSDTAWAGGLAIEVDGLPLEEITDVKLHFPVDGLARADVQLHLTNEFKFEGQMDLHLHLHLAEGDMIEEVTSEGDTGRKHTIIRRPGSR